MRLVTIKPDFVRENSKGADQTAHLRSLVCTFVIRSLERMKDDLAISKKSIF